MAKRRDLVLGFSDHVPSWAKATGRKAAFAQPELHLPQHRADFSKVRQAEGAAAQRQQSKSLKQYLQQNLKQQLRQELQQKLRRQFLLRLCQKFRITYEARQVLYNVCDPSSEPISSHKWLSLQSAKTIILSW